MTAIAAVVAAVVNCLGMMGWLLGTWKAETDAIESSANAAVNLAMVLIDSVGYIIVDNRDD